MLFPRRHRYLQLLHPQLYKSSVRDSTLGKHDDREVPEAGVQLFQSRFPSSLTQAEFNQLWRSHHLWTIHYLYGITRHLWKAITWADSIGEDL